MAACKNCEITKALSDLSSDSSSEDSDYDDILSSVSRNSTENSKTTEKQQKPVQRMPTRRPDPNVFNRNALLARENRRKKKAYVETLEKELDGMKNTNKKLHKLLRKQMKVVKKLENEKQYYKGLISNQSDIINLVSALNAKVPMGSSIFPPKESSYSPTGSSHSACSMESLGMTYDCNDNDSSYEPYSETNWDQLLGMDEGPLPEEESGFCPTNNNNSSSSNRCEVQSNISGEHNYFNNQDDDSGLCLHIARGKISVEYCPSCHLNAKRCNNAPPEQLLVVD